MKNPREFKCINISQKDGYTVVAKSSYDVDKREVLSKTYNGSQGAASVSIAIGEMKNGTLQMVLFSENGEDLRERRAYSFCWDNMWDTIQNGGSYAEILFRAGLSQESSQS